jgi:hypothetical protein
VSAILKQPHDVDASARCYFAGRGTRGKRKKALAAGAGSSAAAAAASGEAADQDDEQEVDVMAVGVQEESVESWQALLAGLAEICAGIGMALQHELCEYGVAATALVLLNMQASCCSRHACCSDTKGMLQQLHEEPIIVRTGCSCYCWMF